MTTICRFLDFASIPPESTHRYITWFFTGWYGMGELIGWLKLLSELCPRCRVSIKSNYWVSVCALSVNRLTCGCRYGNPTVFLGNLVLAFGLRHYSTATLPERQNIIHLRCKPCPHHSQISGAVLENASEIRPIFPPMINLLCSSLPVQRLPFRP
jgi:hypothetical protein